MERRRAKVEQSRLAYAQKLASLSGREREVLELAATGLHAKQIAATLRISARTVEVHKQHIMEKLGVRNVAELVRFAMNADVQPAERGTR